MWAEDISSKLAFAANSTNKIYLNAYTVEFNPCWRKKKKKKTMHGTHFVEMSSIQCDTFPVLCLKIYTSATKEDTQISMSEWDI